MFCLLVLCFVLGMSQRSNPMLGLRPIRHGPHGPSAGELPSPMQNLKGSHHFLCLVSVGFGWYIMRSSIDFIDVEAKPHSLKVLRKHIFLEFTGSAKQNHLPRMPQVAEGSTSIRKFQATIQMFLKGRGM